MFKGKTILILSPQLWGKMHLAKHHYATELAKKGAKVYYVNPPVSNSKFSLQKSEEQTNLYIVNYQCFFNRNIRFHARGFYNILMKLQVNWLLKKIGDPIDIVWCFDYNLYSNLNWFKAKTKIYHPVDELYYDYQIKPGATADYVFSVTQEILNHFHHLKTPKHHIHHGVSDAFLKHIKSNNTNYKSSDKIKVGYVGNLTRKEIDKPTLKEIITQNKSILFEFWGSYTAKQSNIGFNNENWDFIDFLKEQPNVLLHGVLHPNHLAKAIQKMDAFLICYDIQKDYSKGTNYHKIMEYLSTGKVIISNNVTTFRNLPALVTMTKERSHNKELPSLFKNVILNLDNYNSKENMKERLNFALQHSYSKNIDKIKELTT